MELRLEDDLAIKQYLLGDVTGEKQQQLEERLLTDDEYLERLQLIEDELVDEYARGVLTPGEREKFDSYFLSTPERYQKLRFASALRRYVSTAAREEQAKPTSHDIGDLSFWQLLLNSFRGQNPRLGYSLAAALLVMVLGVTWSLITNLRLRNQLESARSHQSALQQELQRELDKQRERTDHLAQELARERVQRTLLEQARETILSSAPAPLPATTISLALTPGLLRGGDATKRLILPSGANMIRLELQLAGDDYKGYKAVLYNDEGAEVMTIGMLRAISKGSSKFVPVIFPAGTISGGDYYVQLKGITAGGGFEDLGKYFLRIIKK